MSTATKEAIDLMEILPESEQNFALEFIKKLVLAWDPDFTKLTPAERANCYTDWPVHRLTENKSSRKQGKENWIPD